MWFHCGEEGCFLADFFCCAWADAGEFCLEEAGECSCFGVFEEFYHDADFCAVGMWLDFFCWWREFVDGACKDDLFRFWCGVHYGDVGVCYGGLFEVCIYTLVTFLVRCFEVEFDACAVFFWPGHDVVFDYFWLVFLCVYMKFVVVCVVSWPNF